MCPQQQTVVQVAPYSHGQAMVIVQDNGNIGDNHRPGGYRLASDLQSLNLNGEFHRDGSYQRQFGGPPIPRQPVPRPDTPEPNAPAAPRPPSRPTSPRPSTPEPRPNPSGGGSDENRFTTWVLRLDTNQHKCVDAHLFSQPFSPDPIILEDDSILQPRGTVVLPIKPEPRHHYNLDISVMTISNVLYTPSERNSELSWPVLEKQGFEWKEVRPADATLPIAMPREFTRVRLHAIQHPNLPGVHLLYASRLDGDHSRLSILPVKVDTRRWRRGVESGVLGTAVDMEGTLGWTEASEHSRFEEIVLGQNRRRLGIDRLEGGDDITTVLH